MAAFFSASWIRSPIASAVGSGKLGCACGCRGKHTSSPRSIKTIVANIEKAANEGHTLDIMPGIYIAAETATEIHIFPQPGSPLSEQGIRVDAVHEAYLRLTPLLSGASRRLHGWTDQGVENGIQQLHDGVEAAKAPARGEAALQSDERRPHLVSPNGDNTSLDVGDSIRRIANLRDRLTDLTALLNDHPSPRAAVH